LGQSFIASALVIAASAIIGAVSLGGIRAQQSLESLSVIVFPGGFNWPIWVAQDKGYFASDGIEVNLTNTPNSVFQLTNLIEGKFDIAMTAIDNVIAYMEGQGEAPTQVKPDLIVFMGGDNGFLSLVTVPEVRNVTDLKGRTVSVDARTTGYAFVLFDLMKRKGLNEADYKVEKAGGVLQRWDALKEKKHDGTLLLTPFDFIAKANGFNVLEYAIDVYGHYQGLVGASRRGRTHDCLDTNIGATTRPILHDECLPQTVRKPLAHQARDDVERTARRHRYDDVHRPCRIGLRPRNPRHGRQCGSACGHMQEFPAGKFHF
jgi:ABC-type nitrate/sulfonate/bicarbonate transport system substrate-binding protein